MFSIFIKQLKPAVLMLFWMTLLTGLAYPLGMTGLGAALFPAQAGGSLIKTDGGVAGSALIGQAFASDKYFHGRPSATSPYEYNAGASAGSNLGPSNPALFEAVAERAAGITAENGGGPVPMDLATASASGLDPHITPEAAAFQLARVAKARDMSPGTLAELVAKHTRDSLFGFWGEPRVNVLQLNLALDAAGKKE
ncbi:potassium-transporting ATPase subunit KdpC [Fundidesulfovibrio soli]|uniref:potassium-transporting ATPase subunit KdpC n=1 Tax=Fundidesulfovibrio soli TaxID=2922716 RepID=UPI002351A5CB|nr:potassium-transporting ATPase subunit KdpC [Fundidesulfovibrio soli]